MGLPKRDYSLPSEQNLSPVPEQKPAPASVQKFSFWTLTAMVVGSMVGAGIFSLPRTFATATGPFGAIIAWSIAGGGMYMLARVFQALAERKPNLDAGVYAYARAGFGDYAGFLSALGYWVGSCIGNVSYWVLIKSTLGAFFPIFGEGNTVVAIVIASVGIWLFHFMILKGVQQAATINTIVTVAKIVPILVFIMILFFAFKADLFRVNFFGGAGLTGGIFEQVKATMLVTVFVFIGIEGASVYSRYASKRSDVGKATILGFIGVTSLMVLVTMLPYAVLQRPEIAEMRQPSMATVLEAVVGHWGAVFVSIGLIVSVLGAYLAWSLICAEVLFTAAKTEDMPRVFARENANKVPAPALAHQHHRPTFRHQHVLVSRRVLADAQDDQCDEFDSVLPGGGVRSPDRQASRNLRSHAERAQPRSDHRRHRSGVHRFHDLRRRHEVRAAVRRSVRARHDPLPVGET